MPAVATIALLAAAPAATAQDDARVRQDLTAVIALQGKPCGTVVQARRQGDNDYVATCENGARYHIFVDGSNRVVVEAR